VCAPLQFLRKWALIGPFDNRDQAGFEKAYGPEEEIEFEKPSPGRNRLVNWFACGAEPLNGVVDLSELFEVRSHSLAYGVTFVKSAEPQWAVLHLGGAGAARVWVNEREAVRIPEYNGFAPEKAAAPVYLHKGWNQVLVKSAVEEDGPWGFAIRLCGLPGGPLPGIETDPGETALKAYRAENPGRNTPLLEPESPDLGLLPRVRAALKASPNEPWLRSWHGYLLAAQRAGRFADRLAAAEYAKAIARCPRCPLFRLDLAELGGDVNQARQAAEACLAQHPEIPLCYSILSRLAAQSQLEVEAEHYAREGLAKFGPERAAPCALELTAVLSRRGENAEAEGLAAGYVSRRPYQERGWSWRARLVNSRRERRAVLSEALRFCGGDAGLRLQWAGALEAEGKEREAAGFLAAAESAGPFGIHARLSNAQSWRRAGDGAKARAALEAVRAAAPYQPEVLSALGLEELQAGKTAEAVALWREVLRVKPDSPLVKDWLADVSKGAAVDKSFFIAYDVPLQDLPQPKAADYPKDHSVTLLNQEVIHVNPNGTASRMVHLVAKLLRPDGVEGLRRHTVFYDPSRQVVDILRAAVITPSGREMSRAQISDRTVSAAMGVQTRIYDEYHLKEIQFLDLEPGSIIDFQYALRDAGAGIYGDFFSESFTLADDQPVLKSQFILDLPKSREFQMRAFRQALDPQRLESKDLSREVFKWEGANYPGVMRERSMPPLQDQLPLVQVTTMKTWQEVGTWYWNLAKDQLIVDEDIQKAVAEITKEARTPTEKLRAIHDWVIRKIRYLGIEFGRNGYKPHRARETMKALYGDCKDTAALMVAMLKGAGIEARLVLVRAVTSGRIESDALPAPNLFNHCIAYVPDVEGQEYWIDGTTDYHELGELPYMDQGAQVLVVGPDGGRFVQIPKATAEENRREQRVQAQVEKSGAGTLRIRSVYRGQYAPYFRELAETPGRFKSQLQEQGARRFSGAELKTLTHAGPDEQGPMWIETEYRVPTLAAQSGDRLALPASAEPLELSRRYLTGGERRHDLELWFPWARTVEVLFHLDPALKPVSLPEEAELKEAFGSFSRKVTVEGPTVRIREETVLSSQRIPKEQYAKFSDFCRKVDALEEQKVLLQP